MKLLPFSCLGFGHFEKTSPLSSRTCCGIQVETKVYGITWIPQQVRDDINGFWRKLLNLTASLTLFVSFQVYAITKYPDHVLEAKRHGEVVDVLTREVILTQTLSDLTNLRLQQQEDRIATVDEALEHLKNRETDLIHHWRKAYLSLQQKTYQLSWQASLLMDLSTRRSDARSLWVLEQLSSKLASKIQSVQRTQSRLEERQKQWHRALVFFHEQQFNMSVKQKELRARVDLEKNALTSLKAATKELGTATDLLEKLGTVSDFLWSKSVAVPNFPLPVLSYALDPAFFQQNKEVREGLLMKTKAFEPIAAIFAGTVQYIGSGVNGLTLRIVSDNGEAFLYKGLSKILLEEGAHVRPHDIVAEAAEQDGWLYLEHHKAENIAALDPSSFVGTK